MPIHYSESALGDLPGFNPPNFSFGTGNNTISGTTSFLVLGTCFHLCPDFDSFSFTVPVDAKLVDISISFDTTVFNASRAEAGYGYCLGTGLCDSNVIVGVPQTVDFLSGNRAALHFLGGAPPLGAGSYTFAETSVSIAPTDPILSLYEGEDWYADYKWTFRVVPVPGPRSLSLLVGGLLALLFMRRRIAA
jgi:hypothetical protein